MVAAEVGYYSSGKDYYSVAGDISTEVFNQTDEIRLDADTIGYFGEVKTGLNIFGLRIRSGHNVLDHVSIVSTTKAASINGGY